MTDPLRRREDAHLARDRRGPRHGALTARRPDAARRDPTRPTGFTHGRAPAADLATASPGEPPRAVRHPIDRESAHEILTGADLHRAGRPPSQAGRGPGRCGAGVPPTTAGGLNTMTPAQQQREIQRQAREIARGPEGCRARAEGRGAPAGGARAGADRGRETPGAPVETAIRTGGKVLDLEDGPGDHPGRVRDAVQRPLTP